jgi:hypothetical protein
MSSETPISRVGIRFDRVPPATQAVLDRYVYPLMQRKARARRPLQSPTGADRRLAPRVELDPSEGFRITMLPPRPLGAFAKAAAVPGAPEVASCVVCDLSTTGCAFLCPSGKLELGQLVTVKLEGRDLSIEVQARVMNLSEVPVIPG